MSGTSHFGSREYCGHWSDTDLARTAEFYEERAKETRRTLAEEEQKIAWVKGEQERRKAHD